jgi:hypothetical protein
MEMHKVSMEDINVDTVDCARSYPRLVRSRKECRLCESLGLTNPALVESWILRRTVYYRSGLILLGRSSTNCYQRALGTATGRALFQLRETLELTESRTARRDSACPARAKK